MSADPTYGPKIQERNGGDLLAVASGGTLDIESGGVFSIAGTDRTTQLTNMLAGLAAGLRVAKGSAAALDGSNPTPIATGLTTIVAAFVQLRGTAAPADATSVLTVDYTGSDGTLNVYGWKNTGGTDPTLVASTGTETFDWIAIGS